jgi:hypothetical protein
MSYIYNLTDTWNAVGTSFNGIKMAITNTASASGSYMINLTTSGATTGSFTVDKSGNVSASGALTLGTVLSVANGGTGLATLTAGYVPYGNGTSAFQVSPIYSNGTYVALGTTSFSGAKLDVVTTTEFPTKLISSNASNYAFMRIENSNNPSNDVDFGVNSVGTGIVIVRAAPTTGTTVFSLNYGPVGDIFSANTSRNVVFGAQIGAAYNNTTGTPNTAAQALGTNTMSMVLISADTTLTSTVPSAGARATVIIKTSGTTSRTVTFGTGFKSQGTLATGTVDSRYWAVEFISDGTSLYETSRTTTAYA